MGLLCRFCAVFATLLQARAGFGGDLIDFSRPGGALLARVLCLREALAHRRSALEAEEGAAARPVLDDRLPHPEAVALDAAAQLAQHAERAQLRLPRQRTVVQALQVVEARLVRREPLAP